MDPKPTPERATGSDAAKRPPGAKVQKAAAIGTHEPFDGTDVDFIDGKMTIKNAKLAAAFKEFFDNEASGTHAAVVHHELGHHDVALTHHDVVVDVRC